MKLLIVESPTKAHHIQEFLGNDWIVKASLGHVRDLEKGQGVGKVDWHNCEGRIGRAEMPVEVA